MYIRNSVFAVGRRSIPFSRSLACDTQQKMQVSEHTSHYFILLVPLTSAVPPSFPSPPLAVAGVVDDWARARLLTVTFSTPQSTYLLTLVMDHLCHECGEPQSVWMVARCTNPSKAATCGESFCFKCLGQTYPQIYGSIFKGLWWLCPVCMGTCKCETCSDPVSICPLVIL